MFTPLHSVCACSKSVACNSEVVVCLCVTYFFLCHFLYLNYAVSFLIWIVLHCHFGAFITDYAVWALLIVEGRIVTIVVIMSVSFGLLWRVASLAIIPHLLFYIHIKNLTYQIKLPFQRLTHVAKTILKNKSLILFRQNML